jgi:hypothetical protein
MRGSNLGYVVILGSYPENRHYRGFGLVMLLGQSQCSVGFVKSEGRPS